MAEKDNFAMWQDWLRGVCILVIVLGLVMAFLVGTDMLPSISDPIDAVFYPDALTTEEKNFRAWAYGVWGATMAGWGIVLLGLVRGPFAKREMWAWRTFTMGLFVWFVIDTGFSAYFEVWINVIVNVAVFILALIPLAMTYKKFSI